MLNGKADSSSQWFLFHPAQEEQIAAGYLFNRWILWPTWGGGVGLWWRWSQPPLGVFKVFKRRFTLRDKLSAVFPSFSTEFLYVKYVSILFDAVMATFKFHFGLIKSQIFSDFLVFSITEITEFHEFVQFRRIMAWFCISFLLKFLDFWNRVEIQIVIPRWRVKWRHLMLLNKWCHLEKQAQGYLINVSLFTSAFTERKPSLYHSGNMS